MEKKAILAIVLSLVVLVGWSLFFGPGKEQAPKTTEIPEDRASEELSKTPEARVMTPSIPPQVPVKPESRITPASYEKEIEIETPLYRAVFSNAGPTIRSFKLKKYRETTDPDSPLIELVSLEKDMGNFLLINFDNRSAPEDTTTICEMDQERIQLGPESSPKDLVFHTITPHGVSVSHTFRFYPDRYNIDLAVDVVNQTGEVIKGSFISSLKVMPPQGKKSYYSYIGLVLLLNDKLEEVKIKKASEEKVLRGTINWMAYEDDYFLSAIVPEQKSSKGIFEASLSPSGLLEGRYLPPSVLINPSNQVSSNYTIYLGPRELGILKEGGKQLAKAVNFGWTDIIAKPLLYALRFFNQYINNYGVSIILLTILIKILFWPLTHKSYKSMKEMQKLQPRMAKIREKYKNNKEQLNREMMALYKTYKVNPMGGCLPMIVQIPVFFALFRILGSCIELRHAPFMLWITDLSAPGRLFSFPFKIPFMAPPYGIPVLTLLMGASMFIQQKMTPTPGDPAQAKIMMFLPVIFTFMFINFPSGLVLYWLVNNILSIGQQYRIHRSPR